VALNWPGGKPTRFSGENKTSNICEKTFFFLNPRFLHCLLDVSDLRSLTTPELCDSAFCQVTIFGRSSRPILVVFLRSVREPSEGHRSGLRRRGQRFRRRRCVRNRRPQPPLFPLGFVHRNTRLFRVFFVHMPNLTTPIF